jgi:hypothetical protein
LTVFNNDLPTLSGSSHYLLPGVPGTRNQLLIDGGLDFKRLLTEKEGVSKLAKWWIRSGRLNQFRLANELIKQVGLPQLALVYT